MADVILTPISQPTIVTLVSGITTELTLASGETVILGLEVPGVQGPQGPVGASGYVHPNHSGDVTSSGDGATVIASGVVTNVKLAPMASGTIKARITAGSGDPEDVTASEIRTLLNVEDGAQVNVATNLAYDATTRVISSSTGDDATLTLVTISGSGLRPATAFDTLAYSGITDLDLEALDGTYKTVSVSGSLEFTTSNRANGRTAVLRLICDGTTRTLTFPSGWTFLGAQPSGIAASKTAVLSLTCFGSDNDDCIAAYAVQL
jgi:hypothetical protein